VGYLDSDRVTTLNFTGDDLSVISEKIRIVLAVDCVCS
jgi:hypothetical protein